ncbi:hypothetical protein BRADI_4g11347v3 [Brachypodium distachyon]|uniref:Embryo surrounding factor 1 brassicaceae domain-containing protein n=1 Tax=Brachypodium distachyon TaxID=15368 RepID=I1IJQ8_BRADI|nr:hypothetical protein BRADI_4g11347v3 [Brachypodium distachyon]
MAASKVAAMIMVAAQLLAVAAPASASGLSRVGNLAARVGIRRLLQDTCIPPGDICCSQCGSWFNDTNCCEPETYICAINLGRGDNNEWCVYRETNMYP